jgi:hypothetical protein
VCRSHRAAASGQRPHIGVDIDVELPEAVVQVVQESEYLIDNSYHINV